MHRYVADPSLHDPSLRGISESDEADHDDELDKELYGLGFSDEMKQCFKDLQVRMGLTTLSTSFSGIDSPGTAMEMLCSSLCKTPSTESRHLFGVKYNTQCQTELLKHPHAPRCLFSDIETFLAPDLKCQLKRHLELGKIECTLIPLLMESTERAVKT